MLNNIPDRKLAIRSIGLSADNPTNGYYFPSSSAVTKGAFPDLTETIVFAPNENKTIFDHYVYETDVLSFPLDFSGINMQNPPLGSIVISIDSALKITKELNHSLRDEMAILFTHGLLHLLGFDHQSMKDYDYIIGLQNEALENLKLEG